MADLTPYLAGVDVKSILDKQDFIQDPRSAFLSHLQFLGFDVNSLTLDRLNRVDAPNDKKGKKSGWFIYHEHEIENGVLGYASYGDWRDGNTHSWTSKQIAVMSATERMAYHAAQEAAKAKRDAEQLIIWQEAAQKAKDIYESASIEGYSAYLESKKIIPKNGIKFSRGDIILPCVKNNQIHSLQFIKPDGQKKFLTGGQLKGCYYKIQGNDESVFICEGYSTGESIHMATGNSVYVAFNAGNLYEVATQIKDKYSRVVIAGDDDQFKPQNAGRTKATQAAQALNIECILPIFESFDGEPTDFNDLHCREGLEKVKEQLSKKPKIYEVKEKKESDDFKPHGILSDIVNYYNATDGREQPLFAIQCAIATCSVICARHFETNYNNRTSLFLINVGKSGTGKEHAKKTMENILMACGEGNIICGDGYTSDSAVLSALVSKPRHVTVIDEFAKYLQASNNKNSNGQQAAANTKLMETFGRLDGTIRPKSYSTMVLTKDKKKELENMVVINPAITLLAMATPDDLFQTISINSVKDGFLNRFLICVSDAERKVRKHKEKLDVPSNIIEWAKKIKERRGLSIEDAAQEPVITKLIFSNEAEQEQFNFQEYCIEMANKLEKYGMAELPGRCNEIAMRLSLISALSENPYAEIIDLKHMQWAINWVKYNFEVLADKLKMSVASSEFESWKKESLKALREAGERGISPSELHKVQPFAKYRQKDREEIIRALIEADLITIGQRNTGKAGRPTQAYFAIGD